MSVGRAFWKMSGSGNDFVVVDARDEPAGTLADPAVIARVCARGTGVGADGIVFVEPSAERGADFAMRYLNSDGSPAALCGNACLCVTYLATLIGAGSPHGMHFRTESGVLTARMVDGLPEVELPPVAPAEDCAAIGLERGERRIGFALVGVPHLVILTDDASKADVVGRGRPLRRHPSLGAAGANVNFLSPGTAAGSWKMRTYERGVEGETLACGTGAIAAAMLLQAWGESVSPTTLETRSGRLVRVALRESPGAGWQPTLRGEGRLVFRGELEEF